MNTVWILVLVYVNAAWQPAVGFELEPHATEAACRESAAKRIDVPPKQVPWVEALCREVPAGSAKPRV